MDYQKNQKYFQTTNYKGAIITIIIGLIIVLCRATVFGLILVVGGIIFVVLKIKDIVTDAEYDAGVASMLNNIQVRALNKLGVGMDEVKEITPIFFHGYDYKGASQAKEGNDGLWRTNKYEAVMLFFSEHEVHCYKYRFDTTYPRQIETTEDYFYKDIVSVSTASDTVQLLGQHIDYEYFKLTTAGGTAFSVSVRDINNAQQSINAMRALLRRKKQQG